jgi:hypothetical protein
LKNAQAKKMNGGRREEDKQGEKEVEETMELEGLSGRSSTPLLSFNSKNNCI